MSRIWNNIKTFLGNLKKLYKLSKMLSYEDNGETIMFSANVESTKDLRAWNGLVVYYEYERNAKLREEYEKKAKEYDFNIFKKKEE